MHKINTIISGKCAFFGDECGSKIGFSDPVTCSFVLFSSFYFCVLLVNRSGIHRFFYKNYINSCDFNLKWFLYDSLYFPEKYSYTLTVHKLSQSIKLIKTNWWNYQTFENIKITVLRTFENIKINVFISDNAMASYGVFPSRDHLI